MIAAIEDEGGPLGVRVDTIPDALRAHPQWVTWRFEQRDGKWTKAPYSINGTRASVTVPTTWTTFEAAVQAYRNDGFDGVGFTFTTGAGSSASTWTSAATARPVPLSRGRRRAWVSGDGAGVEALVEAAGVW